MDKQAKNVLITNDITFLDASGQPLTQSQAFQNFTNYFITESKLLKFVSKPTEVSAGKKALNYIYTSIKRPEMLEDHLLGEEVHNKARKGEREVETTVKVNKKFSTLPDEFDGLIEQYKGNGSFTIKDAAMQSHAQEVAKKVDNEILKAHMTMKRNSGNYANITKLNFADLENITTAEANKLANTIIRKVQIIKNRETSQNVGRPEAAPVAMINPLLYTAIAKSDYYRPFAPALATTYAQSGRLQGEGAFGVDIVEIPQFDPINKGRYPQYSNVGVVISVDNVGGDAVTEPAESPVAGATTVRTYNIRGLLGFGSTRDEEDQRIEFIEVQVASASNPESAIEVSSITESDATTPDGVVKAKAYLANPTDTPTIQLYNSETNATVGTSQSVAATTTEYTFSAVPVGSYVIKTLDGSTVIATSDVILVEAK